MNQKGEILGVDLKNAAFHRDSENSVLAGDDPEGAAHHIGHNSSHILIVGEGGREDLYRCSAQLKCRKRVLHITGPPVLLLPLGRVVQPHVVQQLELLVHVLAVRASAFQVFQVCR